MIIASYNVENLFDRAKAMNLDTWAAGKPVLEKFAELNQLLGKVTYTAADKTRMVTLMKGLGLEKSDQGPFVILRRNRGKLLKRPKTGGIQIIANSRADWAGSLELIDEPVNDVSMLNTGRVMLDLNADVLGVVEAESRPVLSAYNREILRSLNGTPFRHVMLIDGNDERGIDVGLMTRDGYEIGQMLSHADERTTGNQPLFSRDCPEFEITAPGNKRLIVMVNHFKSKGYGSAASSNKKRKAQATRVAAIYNGRIAQGEENIVIMGDLNDTPASDPLKPLLAQTNLKDISASPHFSDGGYPGTYGSCGPSNKIDYMLFSPKLFAKITSAGVFRMGMWPGVKKKKWPAYPEITRDVEAASDHAALWADVAL